ncbi:MAG TPA: tRNA (adenosine(37)-N6)-dimethylallyltransferase MiaA [Candidatus Saccharimonadales bacterium]
MTDKPSISNARLTAASTKPLVVIVGETGSGKSLLALKLATLHNGEIICADSRTIYKGMDIGTAKPSKADQAKVRHHLLDIVQPNEIFTVADFKHRAVNVINEIRQSGRLPIMVGGSGLYVDSVIFDYAFRSRYNIKIRQELSKKNLMELRQLAVDEGFTTYYNSSNRRHLVRLLESGESTNNDRAQLINNVVIIGLSLNRARLRANLKARVETMFRAGLRREVEDLVKKYGWQQEALSGIGYREFEPYYQKKISMSDVKRNIFQHSLNYAKRQRTWFKRNSEIKWFDSHHKVSRYLKKQLQTKYN